MKKFIGILLLSIGLVGFSNSELKSNERLSTDIQFKIPNEIDTTGAKQFWDALSTYCGKTFEGELISAPAGDDFRDKRLVMHVLSCSTDKILIPFNVGDDRSRTWVLTYTNGTIELKHDHRHADGKSDKITMYGGSTSNSGLPALALFPADEETAAMIPAAATNVWWITVNENVFTYNLRRIGTDRFFSVSFDLTKEIETPEASWGWEDYSQPNKE